jgi:hypothetical protein
LLDQQRNVDKLLLVKLERPRLKKLIKAIAATSAAGAEHLKRVAKHDPSLQLDQLSLPPGEVATRDAIASSTTKELLTPFNPNFEFSLLLTQSEALSYASHLAKVAAANETDPQQARSLTALSEDLKGLHKQVLEMIEKRGNE